MQFNLYERNLWSSALLNSTTNQTATTLCGNYYYEVYRQNTG